MLEKVFWFCGISRGILPTLGSIVRSLDNALQKIQFSDLDGTIERTADTQFTFQGSSFRLRHFLVGDHSLQYKVAGANGPGSERDEMDTEVAVC